MTEYRSTKWANQLIASQHSDGKWGYFHSLSKPTKENRITTEHALRRLEILGFTEKDPVIKNALAYMNNCLTGEIILPDRAEKSHNWNAFTELILSTWICRFTETNNMANSVAAKWYNILTYSFESQHFDYNRYKEAFHMHFDIYPMGGRLINPVNFYIVSILSNQMRSTNAIPFLKHIVNHPNGIYYVYDKALSSYPVVFRSKESSRFISAFELLSKYSNTKNSSVFSGFLDWLDEHRSINGNWDLGPSVNDGVFFPLSESWRKIEYREADCTYRINKLISVLKCQ